MKVLSQLPASLIHIVFLYVTDKSGEKLAEKSPPSVLLLYSYDCHVHERVVIEFAEYLKHECGCEVSLDIWEQNNIKTTGAANWINDKLSMSDFIIIIASAGTRFKCNRKKQFRMNQNRPVPDMFVYGADQVAEKVRFAKLHGNSLPNAVVCCFEYTTSSDIPPKLDTLQTFNVMKEFETLYCLLRNEERDRSSLFGKCVESYSKTSTGKQLYEALKDAVQYFKENPNWLGQTLEAISPVVAPAPQQQAPPPPASSSNNNTPPMEHHQPLSQRNNNPASLSSSAPPLSDNDEDSLLQKRQNKRRIDEEIVLEKIPSSSSQNGLGGMSAPVPVPGPGGPSLNTLVPPPPTSLTNSPSTHSHRKNNSIGSRSGSNVDSPMLQLHLPPPPQSSQQHHSPHHTMHNGYVNHGATTAADTVNDPLTDEDDEDDEMLQLQKDIDFIHNYQYSPHNNQKDILLHFDSLPPSPLDSSSPLYSFSNPLYSESSTKHMLLKNGLGRVSVSMNRKKKRNHNNNSFVVVDFNNAFKQPEQPSEQHGQPSVKPGGSSTYL